MSSKGDYATCDDSSDWEPYCESYDEMGHYQRENCSGFCPIQDPRNRWGNVSFCCEYDNGQRYPYNGYKCCDNYDACHDNVEQKNVCNTM